MPKQEKYKWSPGDLMGICREIVGSSPLGHSIEAPIVADMVAVLVVTPVPSSV
jgi:hypothetical protein